MPLTVETCVHYLCLKSEQVGTGQTLFKCCPPIRNSRNQAALWNALKAGDIDFIVSDHSPCTPNLKRFDTGDFSHAWGGIGGLGLALSLLYTESQNHNVNLCQLMKWMSERPAQQIGLEGRKGALVEGADADIVIFDPSVEFTVRYLISLSTTFILLYSQIDKQDLIFKNKISPYQGMKVKGVVQKTFLRGKLVYERTGKRLKPQGQMVLA